MKKYKGFSKTVFRMKFMEEDKIQMLERINTIVSAISGLIDIITDFIFFLTALFFNDYIKYLTLSFILLQPVSVFLLAYRIGKSRN